MFFPIHTLILLALLVGIILLQIFLSRRESRWPGLVLPGLCVLFSLCAAVGLALFSFVPSQDSGLDTVIIPALLVFVLYNIPTCILLAIYFACRERYRRSKQLEKMNILDLEG